MLNQKLFLSLGAAALLSSASAWADVCVAPGELVIEDPTGDVTILDAVPVPANPAADALDLVSLSIATPPADSIDDQTVVFTLTTNGENPLAFPPNNGYFSSFLDQRGLIRGVRAVGDDSGGIRYFSYVASAAGAMNDGPTDGRFVEAGSEVSAEGSYTGGVVTITVKAKNIGVRDAGDVLSGFNAAAVVTAVTPVGSAADVPDTMPDDLLARGSATPIVYSPCAKSLSKSGSSPLAGSSNLLTLLPLLLVALRRRRV